MKIQYFFPFLNIKKKLSQIFVFLEYFVMFCSILFLCTPDSVWENLCARVMRISFDLCDVIYGETSIQIWTIEMMPVNLHWFVKP